MANGSAPVGISSGGFVVAVLDLGGHVAGIGSESLVAAAHLGADEGGHLSLRKGSKDGGTSVVDATVDDRHGILFVLKERKEGKTNVGEQRPARLACADTQRTVT